MLLAVVLGSSSVLADVPPTVEIIRTWTLNECRDYMAEQTPSYLIRIRNVEPEVYEAWVVLPEDRKTAIFLGMGSDAQDAAQHGVILYVDTLEFGISPETVDFGLVEIGALATEIVSIGRGEPGLYDIALEGDAAFTVDGDTIELDQNGAGEVLVHFAPLETGLVTASITISTVGMSAESSISGQGIEPVEDPGEGAGEVTDLLLWDGDTPGLESHYAHGYLTTEAYEGLYAFAGLHEYGICTQTGLWMNQKVDVSEYDAIEFYVKSNTPDQEFYLFLKDWYPNGGGLGGLVFLNDYIEGGELLLDWRRVRIPFADFVNETYDANRFDHLTVNALIPQAEGFKRNCRIDGIIYIDSVRAIRYANE